jgi:ABC-type branched-subunit amino acid transport system substrate-binding protein
MERLMNLERNAGRAASWARPWRILAGLALSCSPFAALAVEPIVIGQVAPFSGPQAVTGKAIHAGAKLYFDADNIRDGVRGRPIKLVTRDDVQKPEDTVRLTRELIAAEAPMAMLGTVGTTNLEALATDGVQPQVVFHGATTAAAIEFVKQYAKAGGTGTLYGMSIIDTEALLRALGPQGSRGYAFSVVLPLAKQTQRAVVREYLELRQASNDAGLSARSIEGFIAAKALVKVLETIPTPTPASLATALQQAKAVDVGGYVLDFSNKERTASNYVDFAMFGSDGKIVQ